MAILIAVGRSIPDGYGSPAATWDPSFRLIGNGLGSTNRHDVAFCINSIGFSSQDTNLLKLKVVDAVPELQTFEGWSDGGFFPLVPVRVDIGCPASASAGGRNGNVTIPSEYILFLNFVPQERLSETNLPTAGPEFLCSGDDCFQVTNSTVVTEIEFTNQQALTMKLARAIGL